MSLVSGQVKIEKRATSVGSYYMAPGVRPEALRQMLREMALPGYKDAAIGGEQEQGFEQAFGALAYSYIRDKAPRLIDYMIGFQLVDRNEDNTKAIGVFGFKVGDQWLYAPIFFLTGDLKGHELLYIKKQDTFVPLKENWVNYIISRKPYELGKGSAKNTYELGGMMPDMSRLIQPPSFGKYGTDGAAAGPWRPHVDSWAVPILPLLGTVATMDTAKLFHKVAGWREALDLRKVLTTLPMLKTAWEWCKSYPLVKQGFDRFYGEDFFLKQAQDLKQAEDSLLPVHSPAPRSNVVPGPFLLPEKRSANLEDKPVKVVVQDDETIHQNLPDLTDEERERLLRDTVLVKDQRDPHSVSAVYNTQVRMELLNPHESGLYEVLEKPSSFKRMLVIMHPHGGDGEKNFATVVRLEDGDSKAWLNTHHTNLWSQATKPPDRQELEKWVKGLGSKDTLKKGGTYIAIGANGVGTLPFEVLEDYGDGAYQVNWRDMVQYNKDRAQFLPRIEQRRDVFDMGYTPWRAKLFINKRKGVGLRSVAGELSVPEDFKILKLKEPPKEEEKDDCCCHPPVDGFASEVQPIEPGNLMDIQLMITEKTAALKVMDLGGEVYLKCPRFEQRLAKKAALISLILDHGLTEPAARGVLKEAAVHQRDGVTFRIKYADGYGLQPGPRAPAIPPPWQGMEQAGPNMYPSIYPQEETQPVPDLDSSRTDPAIYDLWYRPDRKTMMTAQQAAQQGQKEIFDTSMFSGLLKATQQDTQIERHLPDLMKAIDACARLLMLYYWHQEEWAERYGKASMPELEDSLRNALDANGEVALFLKEKQVGSMDEIMNAQNDGLNDVAEG